MLDQLDTELLDNLLKAYLDLWEKAATLEHSVIHLSTRYPENTDLKEAVTHAHSIYGQEINGVRDHLKLAAGREP